MTEPGASPSLRSALPAPVWVAPLVLLVLALGPWPYGYYMFMRLVVCAGAVYAAFVLLNAGQRRALAWTFIALALLYNPIFRVHFERETWSLINLASAAPFALLGWFARQGRTEPQA